LVGWKLLLLLLLLLLLPPFLLFLGAAPPRAGRLAGSRRFAGVGRRGRGKGKKGFRPTLGALGPEPSSGLQKDKYVPDMINTPLDPRPCKNTPSKSQCLCFSLGIAWVRGVAVDLRIERKRWGRKVLRKMSWGFGATRSVVHGLPRAASTAFIVINPLFVLYA